jgi:hypothetical protein
LIQNGHMTRQEGLELCLKYDGEFPHLYFEEVLDYLDLTRDEFTEIIDKHRNPEIWTREGSAWQLRYPLQPARTPLAA